jgi:hypothetical protein
MTTATPQQQLEAFNDVVEAWAQKVRQALDEAPIAQEAFLERWGETARKLSQAIDHAVPPSLDPEQVAEIRGELLGILQEVLAHEDRRPLDAYEQTMLRLEVIRHIVRDALDQHVPGEQDARVLIAGLEQALPRVGRKDLALLLGVSERSIQRIIASPDPVEPARRLLLVARLVALLQRAWTAEGVVAWFMRPRAALGGAPVLDVVDDAAREQDVMALARAGRAQHGS